jgi:phosphatidate phosphatase LPIN
MKVGEAGEAFFVFETEHEVPEEFQTSPIMEAVPEKSEEVPKGKNLLMISINNFPF